MPYGTAPFGTQVFGATLPERVNVVIASSDLIPSDANLAIRKFIRDSFNDLWSTIEELSNLNPPNEVSEYWEIAVQILQTLI